MRSRWVAATLLVCWSLPSLAISAGAATVGERLYSFTGKVTRITGDEIEVKSGNETRLFESGDLKSGDRANLHVGDGVTFWYSMKVERVKRQQAGQKKIPSVQDDRAFYNAKNENAHVPHA